MIQKKIELSTLSIEGLKALVYDNIALQEQAQANIKNINDELGKRYKEQEKNVVEEAKIVEEQVKEEKNEPNL